MKKWSLLLSLGLLSLTLSLVLPPKAALGVLTAARNSPSPLWQCAAHLAYEISLWGSGLSVWILGRRLGWLSPFTHSVGFLLCLLPLLPELALTLSFGHLPSGITGVGSGLLRILVGTACYKITRHRQSQEDALREQPGRAGLLPES